MKIIQLPALLISVAILVVSCETEDIAKPEIKYIGYGTFFGECLGYCHHSMQVTGAAASLTKHGWDTGGQLPDVQCSRQLKDQEYNNIADSIDPAAFVKLDTVIGCPDCADGGAEWVEISWDTVVHRVTFEYGNEPALLAGAVPLLREMMASIEGCNE